MLKDGALHPANLLEGTDIRVKDMNNALVSPDEKYFLVVGTDIAIIDIAKKQEVARFEKAYGEGDIWFEYDDIIYGQVNGNSVGLEDADALFEIRFH